MIARKIADQPFVCILRNSIIVQYRLDPGICPWNKIVAMMIILATSAGSVGEYIVGQVKSNFNLLHATTCCEVQRRAKDDRPYNEVKLT